MPALRPARSRSLFTDIEGSTRLLELGRLDDALRHSGGVLVLAHRTGYRQLTFFSSPASPALRPSARTGRAPGSCGVRSKPRKPAAPSALGSVSV
jgi:hypothetical protein